MATNTSITDVFEKNKYNLVESAKKSRAWFDQEVIKLTKQRVTPKKILAGDVTELKTRIVPGSLYLYMYDPKYKDELPYYDRFPLVLPYDTVPGGFIGLNLHYIPYHLRMQLLNRLMQFATNQKMSETTRIKYSWATVQSAARFNAAKPCIKQYLTNHVVSPFRKIHPENWATAMMLPVEQFVGENKITVWKESQKIIRRG
jgi:hypothetical protein